MSEEIPTPEDTAPRKELRARVVWFIAGSVLNYLLISTPFHWLRDHTTLPILAISACSLAISTSIFFVWNYFINFRTNVRKRDALKRYALAVACMYVINALTLTAFKHFNAQLHLSLLAIPVDLDVVAVQAMFAGLKFFLYHVWVFPVAKEGESA